MRDLILHLTRNGKTLGEWDLALGPVEVTLRDRGGQEIATLSLTPARAAAEEETTLLRPLTEREREAFQTAMGIETTQDMPLELDPTGELTRELIREPTQELTLDVTDELPYEESPATEIFSPDEAEGAQRRLLGLSALGLPVRLPGDDFTMPIPEPTDPSNSQSTLDYPPRERPTQPIELDPVENTDPLLRPLRARKPPNLAIEDMDTQLRPAPTAVARERARLAGAQVNGKAPAPDPVDEPTPVAQAQPLTDSVQEVWFYKDGDWLPRGWLAPGQRASLRGGVVRCLKDGSLLVSPGANFTISAALPGGEQLQAEPGHKPIRFPSGAAVTLWDGERGLHVRVAEFGQGAAL